MSRTLVNMEGNAQTSSTVSSAIVLPTLEGLPVLTMSMNALPYSLVRTLYNATIRMGVTIASVFQVSMCSFVNMLFRIYHIFPTLHV